MIDALPARSLAVLVDRLILEQGRLDPLELLLACDCLSYADYEAWRLARVPDLQGVLRISPDEAADLLARAGTYAGAQGLVAGPLLHCAWGPTDRIIAVGSHEGLARACARVWAPPADRIQLDLFQDSQDQLLEQGVCDALTERRIDAAHVALTRLMALEPRHPRLRRYLRLMQSVEDLPDLAPALRWRGLESMEPLARDLLGHRARDLLAPLWAALAQTLSGRPFDPDSPVLHAGHAWARAGRYAEARQALETEPELGHWPALLIAHAESCRRTGDLAAAHRDWAMLCWEHPLEAEQALAAKDLPDTRMHRLWVKFADADLDLTTGAFPAWLLIADPGTAAAVPPDLAPTGAAGDAYRLLHRLVGGEDDVALRKALAALQPGLLKLFLAGRVCNPAGQASAGYRQNSG
jgi:hypothetical protein